MLQTAHIPDVWGVSSLASYVAEQPEISEPKTLGEKVEKFTSMTDKFHEKFVKPFNADGAKAAAVLSEMVKNPMSFVAISSLIGSALTFVALSPNNMVWRWTLSL